MTVKHAHLKQLQGITFAGIADSGHWIMLDGAKEFGGSDAAVRPKELILLGLGGCTGSDVVDILTEEKVNFTGMEINLTAEVAEQEPQIFTHIHIEYIIYGHKLDRVKVEKALELSQTRYCTVAAMLRPQAHITYSYRLLAAHKANKSAEP